MRGGVARATISVHRLGKGEELVCQGDAGVVMHVLDGALHAADGNRLGAGDTRVDHAAEQASHHATCRAVVLLATLAR